MSLILEALKKIERDKQAPERGVVVLASSVLEAPPRSAMPVAGLVAGAFAVAATLGWMVFRPAPASAPAATIETPAARSEVAPAPIALAPVVPITIAPARPAVAAPVVAPPSTLPAMHLTAIGARDGQPVAVINDQVLQVGDRLGDARVVAIDATSVELEIDGVRRRITF